jgi:hypothetical protein
LGAARPRNKQDETGLLLMTCVLEISHSGVSGSWRLWPTNYRGMSHAIHHFSGFVCFWPLGGICPEHRDTITAPLPIRAALLSQSTD